MTGRLQPARDFADALVHEGPRSIHAHVSGPILQRLVKSGAHTVLDMGCGNGWFAGALDRCGYEVVGVDHDPSVLQMATQQHPTVAFHRLDVMDPLGIGIGKRFDAVVAIDLIDCVPMPRRLIESALAVLKPGGALIVTSAYYGYAKNLALAIAGRFDARWDPLLEHGRMKFFSRSTLTTLFNEFELEELQFQTVGRIPMFARSMVLSGTGPR